MRHAVNCIVMAATLIASSAYGQSAEVEHWALAPFLGTGAYDFDGETTVYVLEYTPRWTLKDAAEDGSVMDRARIELLVPVTHRPSRERLLAILRTGLRDTVKGRVLRGP